MLINDTLIWSFAVLLCTTAMADEGDCAGSVTSILQCLDQKHSELDSQLNALTSMGFMACSFTRASTRRSTTPLVAMRKPSIRTVRV